MRVRVTSWSGKPIEMELSAALKPYAYCDSGIAESAQRLADENAEAIGRLLALLVDKEVITLEEAVSASGHSVSNMERIP